MATETIFSKVFEILNSLAGSNIDRRSTSVFNTLNENVDFMKLMDKQKRMVWKNFLSDVSFLIQLMNERMFVESHTRDRLNHHQYVAVHRLQQQKSTAHKRLQELVFEVIGEYQKAYLRAKTREEDLIDKRRANLLLITLSFRWKFFLLKFSKNLQISFSNYSDNSKESSCSVLVLDPTTDAVEIQRISNFAKKQFHSTLPGGFFPLWICKFTKVSKQSHQETKVLPQKPIIFAQTIEEMKTLLDYIEKWLTGSAALRRNPPTTFRNMNYDSCCLLSNESIRWINPASIDPNFYNNFSQSIFEDSTLPEKFFRSYQMQHSSSLLNNRIYFCLEERALLVLSGKLFTQEVDQLDPDLPQRVCTILQEIYVDFPNTTSLCNVEDLREALLSQNFEYIESLNLHQRNSVSERMDKYMRQYLRNFPEIIVSQSRTTGLKLHFAAACVSNLKECWDGKDKLDSNLELFCLGICPLMYGMNPKFHSDEKISSYNVTHLRFIFRLHPFVVKHLVLEYLRNIEIDSTECAEQKWNCLSLLPDDCRERLFNSTIESKVHQLKYTYMAIPFDYHAQDLVTKTPMKSLYLIQMFPFPDIDASLHLPWGDFKDRASFSSDEHLFRSIIVSYISKSLNFKTFHIAPFMGPENRNAVLSSESEMQWDPSLMTSTCYWRSCLCLRKFMESTTNGRISLCPYHHYLQKYLDEEPEISRTKAKSVKKLNLESSKYLPRKVSNLLGNEKLGSNAYKKDISQIRAASTLLIELWDGRLKTTVRAFSKKVTKDIGFRNVLEVSSAQFLRYKSILSLSNTTSNFHFATFLVPNQPIWTVWKSSELSEE
jgi:hypothetical protein